jgi:hypothetical protein
MKTTITIIVPKNLHSKFKIAAINKGCTMTTLLLDCIKKIIKEDEDEK